MLTRESKTPQNLTRLGFTLSACESRAKAAGRPGGRGTSSSSSLPAASVDLAQIITIQKFQQHDDDGDDETSVLNGCY